MLKQFTTWLVLLVMMIIVVGFSVWLINLFDYLDPFNLCYINIESDVTRGNTKTIHQAIEQIKKADKSDYRNLCHFVNVISENLCMADDPNRSSAWRDDVSGCYLRGSKVIYLNPSRAVDEGTIAHRARIIKIYSQKSKNFWQQ
ncbi:MAG: hypothetical protein COS76_00805 [Candidatus Portnoybacteria bacterium CG06_land_8_20_14_3_00_39_12]|uniref:Uncharacterized protein n=3 Tax=Candidatus Portnoyibacteriota TaxID=1817913 RepID=A0A2M8KGT3_9BACT|nr:MAG: hypothetical protein COS76_00805 [Candidatus Portnoybacteria bacterium CG06_land_8_20_14_3_00_39_12]PIZ70920.1 MAG: hypothetical protein COY09_01845 [Candidatus Portnoybacteria bacterium CG_4_10_14_0_2_um_filter_39_11]PJE59107.1 MAG: hypothetical protein COU83_00475 [Candidatus Portnoybacteria bacterium CG10_big_fil_rev_8_21_14_0_10_40_22]